MELATRVEQFLATKRAEITVMKEEEFEVYKNSVLVEMTKRPESLYKEAKRLYLEI